MGGLRLRMDMRFVAANRHSFGTEQPFVLEVPQEERLWAFALADRSSPQVFDYTPDEEGLQSLANLLRSEEVLAVVRGTKAKFEILSVVELSVGEQLLVNRLPLQKGQ